ncbi:hypothetical protein SAMN05421805_12535 [Saccharopolyspora antimicrobica]|uniref:Uncharacterized protein n=1 Tax=Saccharopolyspora antimicrobica TaxID=455193 RepID=A0A1I5K3G5_9PSEU|nr:hypothetical protein [Saccharopolyspora antimicrobica]RKT84775.1 hypothetical protein ATL45_3100 [Saccharopolyspora antimicrobica]SFO79528.1 hypothetical protein SAMN05421805_12535 [Saccharopolyspora antimicrobica]
MDEQDRARHELLLRLAPRLPDDVVWQARSWSASDQWPHAARLVVQVFLEWNQPLPPDAREVLLDGVDPATAERVEQLEDADELSVQLWDFEPREDEISERYAEIVRAYLADQPGTHTAWSAWRAPAGGAPLTARPLHLVETQGGVKPPVIAAELADRLWRAGLASPQVEVFTPESPLDAYYHAPALVAAREIHATGPAPHISLARFDETNPEREPAGPDRDAQVAYLASGEPLTEQDELLPDLLSDDEEPVVPVTLRTDGTWIWSDLTTYYLANHGIALPPELRAHIAESGPKARTPTRREWVAMVALENQPA